MLLVKKGWAIKLAICSSSECINRATAYEILKGKAEKGYNSSIERK